MRGLYQMVYIEQFLLIYNLVFYISHLKWSYLQVYFCVIYLWWHLKGGDGVSTYMLFHWNDLKCAKMDCNQSYLYIPLFIVYIV